MSRFTFLNQNKSVTLSMWKLFC